MEDAATKTMTTTMTTTTASTPHESSRSALAVEDPSRDAAEAQARHQLAVNATWYREKGNKAFKKRKYDVAHALYTKGIRHKPTSKLFCNRSMANLRRGRPQDAFLDASLAMKLSPRNVKAYVRRAAALQKLGKLKEAAEDLEKACSLGTDRFVLKMLEDVRLCLARVEASAEDKAKDKGGSVGEGVELKEAAEGLSPSSPRGKTDRLQSILRVLNSASEDTKTISSSLGDLLALLEAETDGDCLDCFFACGGVSKTFSVFAHDNLKVASILGLACGAGTMPHETREQRTRKRAHRIMFLNETTVDHFDVVLDCVAKKRVALVSKALDIADVFLEGKEYREHFLESKDASARVAVVLSIFARAAESLAAKAGAVVARIAHMKRFVSFGVAHHSNLARGLHRLCASRDDESKGIAVSILHKVQHSKAILSMVLGRDLGTAVSNLVSEAVASRQKPQEGEQIFVSAAFTMAQLNQLAEMMTICASLCIPRRTPEGMSVSKDFVTELGDKGTWSLVIRMVESHCYNLRAAAITAFVSACKCLPELSFLVARDKAAFQIFYDIFTNSSDSKCQEEISFVANVLCALPEFHHLLSTRCRLGDLLKIVESSTSDATAIAICRILVVVTRKDEDFLDKICADAVLLKILVTLWYQRRGTAKYYVLHLLQIILYEEKASKLLTESAEEGQIMTLIEDLAKHKVMVEAKESGGASLFGPETENDLVVAEKARLVDQLDIAKVCTYLDTLVDPHAEEKIVVEICAASGRLLGSRLLCTQIADKMKGSSVYAVDWVKALVDQVQAQSNQGGGGGGRVYASQCDYETVDQVPAKANLTVIAGIWQSLEDPPQLFQSIKTKLCEGGKVVLIERERECLEDAKHWARKSGFEVFAEPKHISGCAISVMQL